MNKSDKATTIITEINELNDTITSDSFSYSRALERIFQQHQPTYQDIQKILNNITPQKKNKHKSLAAYLHTRYQQQKTTTHNRNTDENKDTNKKNENHQIPKDLITSTQKKLLIFNTTKRFLKTPKQKEDIKEVQALIKKWKENWLTEDEVKKIQDFNVKYDKLHRIKKTKNKTTNNDSDKKAKKTSKQKQKP